MLLDRVDTVRSNISLREGITGKGQGYDVQLSVNVQNISDNFFISASLKLKKLN